MKVLAVLVTVQILAGNPVETNLIPYRYMPAAECEVLAAKINAARPDEVRFDDRGRKILRQYDQCMPVDIDFVLDALK